VKKTHVYIPKVPNGEYLIRFNLPGIYFTEHDSPLIGKVVEVDTNGLSCGQVIQVGFVRTPNDLTYREGRELLAGQSLQVPSFTLGLVVASQLSSYFLKGNGKNACWVLHDRCKVNLRHEEVTYITGTKNEHCGDLLHVMMMHAGEIRHFHFESSRFGTSEQIDQPTKIIKSGELIFGVVP